MQEEAGAGLFGGNPELQGQLSGAQVQCTVWGCSEPGGAQGELLKANKKSHELERHTVKLEADIKEMERELEQV